MTSKLMTPVNMTRLKINDINVLKFNFTLKFFISLPHLNMGAF